MQQQNERQTYQGLMHRVQKKLMVRWYNELDAATETGHPAVYLMVSGNCVELLRAFDVLPVYPEINALQLAIRNKSLPALLKSEELGYATDNCGYVKADIGANSLGDKATLGTRLPKPALILCNYVGCNTYVKWFEHLAALTGAPLYVLDIPFMRQETASPEDVQYVVRQLEEIIKLLEKITGKKLDIENLKEHLKRARTAEDLWCEVRNFSKHRPAPYDAYFDNTTMMGPLYVYRGMQECIDFFEVAKKEFQERARQGLGAVSPEKFRIVVEGPPPYPYFRKFRDMLAHWGACAVASTYSTVGGIWEFGFRHDSNNPLYSIAEHMISQNLANRSFLQRYEQIDRYIEEYSADALLIHSVKSCRLFSAGQGDMREYFFRQREVPTLFVESDLEDPRYFSAAQMQNRIDAFFESLEHQKLYKSHPTLSSGGPR
ncbi:2-hydroxyacyl-CoA dehydratase family protein [bacterium]|nr:2-hydroxyacyl-CoA dehydratase family protein [bacterium]MCI0607013.1 2-hydroxyacyl-CoA dehydratase family protein [bacterium]